MRTRLFSGAAGTPALTVRRAATVLPTARRAAAGWTWARLIQDGKALLAIDEDNPDRIVSTDKKALKAGGLMLALAGQPVRPTDDVDVEKEYQLVAM